MPVIFKAIKAGTLLSGSSATVFSPATGRSYIVSNIRFYNNSGSPVTVTSINVGAGTTKPRINASAMTISASSSAVFNAVEITLDGPNGLDVSATGLPASTPGLNYLLSGVQKV